MKPNYGEIIAASIRDYFLKQGKNHELLLGQSMKDSTRINDSCLKGEHGFPISALVTTSYLYATKQIHRTYRIDDAAGQNEQIPFDYENMMPVTILPQLWLYSTDFTSLSEMEELISGWIGQIGTLRIPHPTMPGKFIPFSLRKKAENGIRRGTSDSNGNGDVYWSAIYFESTICASQSEKFSEVQLDLDPEAKPFLLERLAALETIKDLLAQDDGEDKNERLAKLVLAWQEMDQQLQYTEGKMVYSRIWEYVNKEGLSIPDAVKKVRTELEAERKAEEERIAKQKQKEEEAVAAKERKIKLMQAQSEKSVHFYAGDPEINRITDCVAKEIGKKFSEFNFHIYAGSNYFDYYRRRPLQQVEVPCLVIKPDFYFPVKPSTFTTTKGDGTPVVRYREPHHIPLKIRYSISVQHTEEEWLARNIERITALFKEDMVVDVPDTVCSDEHFHMEVKGTENSSYAGEVPFSSPMTLFERVFTTPYHACVYHINAYDKALAEKNKPLQISILKQMDYLGEIIKKGSDAHVDLNGIYSKFVSGRRSLIKLFESEAIAKLYECIGRGQPINREDFAQAFEGLVTLIPDLFERYMAAVPVQKLQEDLDALRKEYKTVFTQLGDSLGLPTESLGYKSLKHDDDPRSIDAISFYIKYLNMYSSRLVDDAVSEYKECLKDWREKQDAEFEAQRKARAEYEASHPSESSGGGFLSNAMSTAAGVAIGNKITGNSERKDGKKDLL